MKRTVLNAVAVLALLLPAGCREKGLFTLQGTIENGSNDSILVIGLDSRFDRTDTIRPSDGRFEWSFRPDTATTLILLLPDGREQPVFAERGVDARLYVPDTASGLVPTVTGSPENEAFSDFAMRSLHDVSFSQTAERIDSFIAADPFSEVTPYLIYEYAVRRWHAGRQDIMKLVNRMSGIMQDAPFLTNLKQEMGSEDIRASRYLERLNVYDTAGVKFDFADMGDRNNFTLVCIWAPWNGDEGLEARRDMDTLIDLFHGRHLVLADISIGPNPESWKKAVSADTLSWLSFIDHDGWNSRLVRMVPDIELPAYVLLTETKRVSFMSRSIDDVIYRLEGILPLRFGEARMIRW